MPQLDIDLFDDFILSALLLFVSMIGAIVLTYDTKGIRIIKYQDANLQALRKLG